MSTRNMPIYKTSRFCKVCANEDFSCRVQCSLYSAYKMLSRSTGSSGLSLSSLWSNARCKIISSSFSGQSVTGTSTIQVASTMLLPDGKELEARQQLQPRHRSLLVLLVPGWAPLMPLDGEIHPQQPLQRRGEQDQRREGHPRL